MEIPIILEGDWSSKPSKRLRIKKVIICVTIIVMYFFTRSLVFILGLVKKYFTANYFARDFSMISLFLYLVNV